MGAKDSVKFNLRRPTFKCDMCPKKFLSFQALERHINFLHKIKPKAKVRQPNELNTLLGKPVKSLEMAKKSVEESDKVSGAEPAQTSDVRKIEYECPQCSQCFAVYFSAFRHIQKNHCINSNGEKVALDSTEIIKPVRIEVCMKCNQRLRSKDPHSCSDMSNIIDIMATYTCTGCKQQFNNLKLFNMHVTGLHCDEVETLFFPSRDAFNSWKEDVESQSKVKYLILDKNSSLKQIYQCTYLSSSENDEENVVHFCPSSIFVRDFTKSIQVHFYKQHFGHDSKYKLPDRFNKYKIKQLLKVPTPITEPFELKNLLMDFKTLMNFLVLESSKCDKATIEVLQKKAQEMLTIVNNSDEPTKTNKRNMTDDQISETLESFDAKKRKKVDSPVVKAQTSPDPKPVIVKAFSLAQNTNAEKQPKRNLRGKQKETPPIGFVMNSSPCSSKSSFNDSYREFVDKNFKSKSEKEETQIIGNVTQSNGNQFKTSPPPSAQKNQSKPSTPLSTQKNQPKPSPPLSTQKNTSKPSTPLSTQKNQSKPSPPLSTQKNQSKPSTPLSTQKNQSKPITPLPAQKNQSKPSTPLSTQKTISKPISKPNSVKTKKKVVKTKIGQFKPSFSPKKAEVVDANVSVNVKDRRSSSIGKVDFEYEVREQENDCNILVLRF